jgi:hypothetical protein
LAAVSDRKLDPRTRAASVAVSAAATAWVWRHSPYKNGALNVHAALADTANDLNDNQIWFGIEKLSRKARVGRSTAIATLGKMIDDGFLEIVSEQRGQAAPKVHRLLFPDDAPVVYEDNPRPTSELVQKSNQCKKGAELVQLPESCPITQHKEPNVLSRAKNRKTPVAIDFTVTDALRAWCIEKGVRSDPDQEAPKFVDHHLSKGSLMIDWSAAFRTWMRNADKFNPPGRANGQSRSAAARSRVRAQIDQSQRGELSQ